MYTMCSCMNVVVVLVTLAGLAQCQSKPKQLGILMTGGWQGVNQFYNPFDRQQPRVVDYGITPMWGPASAQHRSRVYIMGGRDNDGVSDQVQIYDPSLDKAFNGKPMLTARRWHSAVNLRSQLFVCGGTGQGGQALNSCEAYNVGEHEWYSVAAMPGGGRYAHVAVTLDEVYMYVLGGWNGQDFLSDVLEYDVFKDEWRTQRARMIQPRMAAAGVEYHGHIVVCGGWMHAGRLHTCEIYSPFMDKWSFGPVMMEARSSHGMVVFQDEIFLIAGEDDEYHMLDSIEHYDLRNNQSKLLKAHLLQPMRDFTAVVVGTYK